MTEMFQKISVESSRPKQVIDITGEIEKIIKNKKLKTGTCFIFVKHTTCALTTADLDPGTDLDMLDAYEAMIPKLKYRHPHDPSHVGEHIMSSLIGSSVMVPFENGKLILGTWQRVVLVELSGPRSRELLVNYLS